MDNNILLDFLRKLAPKLRNDEIEDIDNIVETLTMTQDHLAVIYQGYEAEDAPEGAEMLRDLMMEALQLMFVGVDEFFNFLEDGQVERLDEGLALVEEGNDIMTSIKHAVENNQDWTSSASLG